MFSVRPVRVGSFKDDAARAERAVPRAVAIGTTLLEGLVAAQAPVDTGFLKNSVRGEASGSIGVVRVGAEYGAYVNYGTRRMAPNPFFDRALDQFRPMWARIVEREVTR